MQKRRGRKASFLVILTVCVFFANNFIVTNAYTKRETLNFAVLENELSVVDRILYTAFDRMGYNIKISPLPVTYAFISADNGELDGLATYVEGIDEKYTSLLMSDEPVEEFSYSAYTKKEKPRKIAAWSELSNLRVGHLYQRLYIEKVVPADTALTLKYKTVAELFEALRADEIDVAVVSKEKNGEFFVPDDILDNGVIEVKGVYTYFNKKNSKLVTPYSNEIRKMKADGTFDKIISNEKSLEDENKKKVLSISSYGNARKESAVIQEEIKKKISDIPEAELYTLDINPIKYIDEYDRNTDALNSIRANYVNGVPDVIIVSNNLAFEFIKSNYFSRFKDVPVVFCGLKGFSKADLEGYEKYFTGVVDEISVEDTVEAALTLFPLTENLFVINDYSDVGIRTRVEIERKLEPFAGRLDIRYNDDSSYSALLSQVALLPEKTVILFGSYYVDGKGETLTENLFQKMLRERSEFPVFGLLGETIGQGQFGGKYTNPHEQGRIAAETAQRLANGESILEHNVMEKTENLNKWMFDYNVLSEYGLQKSKFMGQVGGEIVNKPQTIREVNPYAFKILLATGIIVSFLLGLLYVMLIHISRKNTLLEQTQTTLHTAEEMLSKEKEIAKSKEDTQKLIDTMPVALMLLNPCGNEIEYMNRACAKMFGYNYMENIKGLNATMFFVENEENGGRVKLEIFIDEILKSTVPIARNLNCKGENGQIIATKTIGTCFATGDVMLIISDISAEKRKSEILENIARNEKQASDIKSRFIINMSHEIRTPMNAIIGLSEIQLAKSWDKGEFDIFNKINKSAKKLMSVVSDILDFSKIEAEELELAVKKFSLYEMIERTVEPFLEAGAAKDVGVVTDIKCGMPSLLVGDETRISQVLSGVLDNAVKFTKSGTVTFSAYEIGGAADTLVVAFEIADTGIGMQSDDVERFLSPFTQMHEDDAKSDGAGLGLTLSKRLTELMGGQFVIESCVGEGTKVTIKIPFAVAEEEPVDTSEGVVFTGARVILCEDNPINQEVAQGMLEVYGIVPAIANNGLEALELLENGEFDLILMDIMMPVLNGYETIAKIRKSTEKWKNIPVIAMTANVSKNEIKRCNEGGFDGHVAKPIEFENLYAALYKFLPERLRIGKKDEDDDEEKAAPMIEGNNVSDGLRRFAGKADRYTNALISFSDGIDENIANFEVAVSAGDRQKVQDIVHMIKGVAANLGITAVADMASRLERQGYDDEDCVSGFKVLLKKTKDDIINAFRDNVKGNINQCEKEIGGDEELWQLLEKLVRASDEFDSANCEEIISQLTQKNWNNIENDSIRNMEKLADDYEYEQLKVMAQSLGKGGYSGEK